MSQAASSPTPAPKVLFDGPAIDHLLGNLAAQIVAQKMLFSSLALVGLPTRGVWLARRLAKLIAANGGTVPPVGQIDVTFHRDDLDRHLPIPQLTEIPFDATNRHILLVDDVLYTGRTIRAALNAMMDFGRPASIHLLSLIDRGHRQLPIQPDFIGERIETKLNDQVAVRLHEVDGRDAIELIAAS